MSEEKTEQPSQLKLREARKKGQVAKSGDLVTAITLSATVLFLLAFFSYGFNKISFYLNFCYALINGSQELAINEAIIKGFDLWFILSLPVMSVAALAAMTATFLQIGFVCSSHPLKPDFKRIDAVAGLKKMFGRDKWIELLKQVFKFSLVLYIIVKSIKSSIFTISWLSRVPLKQALGAMAELLWSISQKLLLALIAMALLDVLWQRFSFMKSLRMSKLELKKEHKQQEGDPVLKQERKRLWQEALDASSHKGGSFVVVNPSHLAIVLLYDEKIHQAPLVVAKGMGPAAKNLVRKARHRQVPIIRNVSLARDLWWVDINGEIPANLFNSVAEILTFIYELSAQKNA